MTIKSSDDTKTNPADIFDEADETVKDYIYKVLTDHISIEDVMGDIIAIYFCKQGKISDFQRVMLPKLSFSMKFQILKDILKIENSEKKPEIIKKIKYFTESRNLIAHRKRGLSISKEGVTFYRGRNKYGVDKELTEADRFLTIELGRECLEKLTEIREEMKRKYYS